MIYKLFADTHLGSPIEIKPESLFIAGDNTILLGDVIDNANCLKKMVPYYNELWFTLKAIHQENMVDGNHERNTIENEVIVKNGIVFAHGDIEANYDRWIKYRQKPHGAGWFKRRFIIPFIREAEEIIERKPKQEFLEKAYDLSVQYGCHTYVCGHFHPKEVIQTIYKGKKIVIVPRGMTEIEL